MRKQMLAWLFEGFRKTGDRGNELDAKNVVMGSRMTVDIHPFVADLQQLKPIRPEAHGQFIGLAVREKCGRGVSLNVGSESRVPTRTDDALKLHITKVQYRGLW